MVADAVDGVIGAPALRLATVALALCVITGCASAPEVEERRRAVDTRIVAILEEGDPDDPAMRPKRCLADREYTSFTALGDRYMLFEGRRGKQWLNTLPHRCPDLRFGNALQVRMTYGFGRICRSDRFASVDFFDWPWYRRWPWYWRPMLNAQPTCIFGDFHPVNEVQVAEIRALFD